MYSENDRELKLNKLLSFLNNESIFEGVLQIGSGTVGFYDIYSDIDLMVGCTSKDTVCEAKTKLIAFFEEDGSIYIDKRKWTNSILGLSVYYENGISIDISYMPTHEIQINSTQWKILISKTKDFENHIIKDNEEFIEELNNLSFDNSIHHKFIYCLRNCIIAIKRNDFIYAEMQLSEARKLLYNVEVLNEGKKLHQFKAYGTLNQEFLTKVFNTYPKVFGVDEFNRAKDTLLECYIETIKKSNKLVFDEIQLKLLII